MVLKNCQIICEDKIIKNGWIEIENNKISQIQEGIPLGAGIDLNNNIIIPGFIDMHIHGGYGVDLINFNNNQWNHFAKNITSEGVTKFCPTFVTSSRQYLERAMDFAGQYIEQQNNNYAKAVGIHLEGPFISNHFLGAHDLKSIVPPNIDWVKQWIKVSKNNIKIITYAIENQDGTFTRFLKQNNIIASVGHSNATFDNVINEIKNGLSQFCHLHNAMSKYDHRHPGVLPAGLYSNLPVELIADGIHIDSNIINLTYKIKGADQIILITDAISAKAMDDGDYLLANLQTTKTGAKVVLKNTNTLSGSAVQFNECFANIIKWTNCSLMDAIKMSSINAAKQLKIFDKTGSIAINKLADLVVLDKKYQVLMTICEGQIIYNKGVK